TAVDFYQRLCVITFDNFFKLRNFFIGISDKILSAKTWIYTHYTNQIDVVNHVFKQRHIGMRRSEERRVGKECRSRWARYCSSRRRHTRFSRDWSSDVCSSDLHRRRFLSTFVRYYVR